MTLIYWAGLLILDTCLTFSKGQKVTLPSSSTAVEGDSFRLKCTVTGGPDPPTGLLTFKYGGTDACLVNSVDCSQVGNPQPRFTCGAVSCGSGQTRVYFLDINPVSYQDGRAALKCEYNGGSSIGSLTVNFPLNIFPSSSTTVEGNSFQLTCTVIGGPDPSIPVLLTFMSGTTDVCLVNSADCSQVGPKPRFSCGAVSCGSGHTRVYFLDINPVKRQDDRDDWKCQYSAVISNNSRLTVNYPPNKPTITDPGSLCEGKSTSLTCFSSDPGNPPATYYWTKNNVSMATGSPYTFTPGRDDHQTQIRCEAGNNHTDRSGHSRPQSNERQLNVFYIPRITISPPSDQTRMEGQSLSFNCSADSNPDNAFLSWTFNGKPLTGVSVEKTNLSRSDHGVYTCTGRVNTGSVCPGGFLQGQGNVSVIVNFAPDIIFNHVDIREGEALTLTCEANGRPEIYTFGSFTQYWGDTQVENQVGTTTGSQYTWTRQTATYLDTGVYECSVDNTVTDRHNVLVQRKRVSVHVRASPIFTMDTLHRATAEIGSTVILSQAFFNSNLNYSSVRWTNVKLKSVVNRTSTVTKSNVSLKKNGKVVKLTGYIASVVFNNFKDKDTGIYTVTVCNSIGCSSSDINLMAAAFPVNTSMTFSLGTGLGIGLGISLLVIIGLVVLVVYYRGRKITSQNKGTTHQSDKRGQIGDEPSDNRGYISDYPGNQNRPEYSHLEERDPEQCAQVKLYETITGAPNDVMRHGSLDGGQPATYETVRLQTYENSVNNPKDPSHPNTSRT